MGRRVRHLAELPRLVEHHDRADADQDRAAPAPSAHVNFVGRAISKGVPDGEVQEGDQPVQLRHRHRELARSRACKVFFSVHSVKACNAAVGEYSATLAGQRIKDHRLETIAAIGIPILLD